MARHEQDREDLMREATALVERVELVSPEHGEPIVLGVRRDGCLSIYLSAEKAVHFNTQAELRRAFVHGQLWKAEQHRLVTLTRHRTDNQVQLLRRDLSDAAQRDFLKAVFTELAKLRQDLADDLVTVQRAVPADLPARERIHDWLDSVATLRIAASPHAR